MINQTYTLSEIQKWINDLKNSETFNPKEIAVDLVATLMMQNYLFGEISNQMEKLNFNLETMAINIGRVEQKI